MAIANSDIDGLPTRGWARVKQAAIEAMTNSALAGISVNLNGRGIVRITPENAMKMYRFADEMEQAESTESYGGLALVQYGERV